MLHFYYLLLLLSTFPVHYQNHPDSLFPLFPRFSLILTENNALLWIELSSLWDSSILTMGMQYSRFLLQNRVSWNDAWIIHVFVPPYETLVSCLWNFCCLPKPQKLPSMASEESPRNPSWKYRTRTQCFVSFLHAVVALQRCMKEYNT
jgi:hypothetical protein